MSHKLLMKKNCKNCRFYLDSEERKYYNDDRHRCRQLVGDDSTHISTKKFYNFVDDMCDKYDKKVEGRNWFGAKIT